MREFLPDWLRYDGDIETLKKEKDIGFFLEWIDMQFLS